MRSSEVHGTATISDADVGAGSFVGAFAIIGERCGRDAVRSCRVGPGAMIRSHTVIYEGCTIGSGFTTGHGALVRQDCEIADDVSVGSHTVIEHEVTIGRRTRIHSRAFIPEFSVLMHECWIGPGAILTNARYPLAPDAKERIEGVTVERGAKVGAGAVLLPGVVIGAGALVGAGAVVVSDVPPGAVVVGNPARVVNWVEHLPYGDPR